MISALDGVALATRAWAESQKIPAWFQPATGSTNTVAKQDVLGHDFASLYLTESQNAGRGRNQNTWLQSAAKGQLFSSWVFSLEHTPQPILSPLIGLALYQALESTWGSQFALKAPNDIYLGDRKLAGILIENVQGSGVNRMIVGIGLNVFSKPDLATACCLADALSEDLISSKWSAFLDQLFLNLKHCALNQGSYLSLNQARDILSAINRFVGLKEKYVEVVVDGSLKTASRTINWSEL